MRLRNHSAAPVRLTPCPSYTEYLGVFSGPRRPLYLARHYYLNCAAIRRIPARGSVTFAMRIPVPAGARQAKLDWQLQGTDVAAATVVTIRGQSRQPLAGRGRANGPDQDHRYKGRAARVA